MSDLLGQLYRLQTRILFVREREKKRDTVPPELKGDLIYTPSHPQDFVFKGANGIEYHFNQVSLTNNGLHQKNGTPVKIVGRLRQVLDRNGDGVVIDYVGGDRKILSVRDVHSTGDYITTWPSRRIHFDYNASGLISKLRRTDGHLDPSPPGGFPPWDFTYTQVDAAPTSSP